MGRGARVVAVAILAGLSGAVACRDPSPKTAEKAAPSPGRSAQPASRPASRPSSQPAGAASQPSMAGHLANLAAKVDPSKDQYANVKRREQLQAQRPPDDPEERLKYEVAIALQDMRSGYGWKAANRFESILRTVGPVLAQTDPAYLMRLRHSLAVSHLRRGWESNGLVRPHPDAFLFPIQGGGVHRNRAGAQAAATVYAGILRDAPHDLAARWLFNIVSMELGQYPHGVPKPWLMPPELFESEYPLPRFPDVAGRLGIDTLARAGGANVDDFDGDGFLDIIASSWGRSDQIHFFHNNGDGTFVEHTEQAGLIGIVGGLNTTHADYDNDGDMDLLVLRGAWRRESGRVPNSLLKNDGRGVFSDATRQAGVYSEHPTQTAIFADFDNDGWLDLFIGNESAPEGRHACELYKNNRDGTFTDTASAANITSSGYIKGAYGADYDNDGYTDIYVSRLSGLNSLYRNLTGEKGKLAFEEVTDKAGVAEPRRSFPGWFFDYDNDGWTDLFCIGYRANPRDVAAEYLGLPHEAELPRLYKNKRDGTFEDVTRKVRLDRIMYTMGSGYGDLDNDGYIDIFAGTGDPHMTSILPERVFRNDRGRRFQDVTTAGGFGSLTKGHGVAFADIDHDGDQDIFHVLGGGWVGDLGRDALYVNPGNDNHWLKLHLQGIETNRCAIGARIEVVVRTPKGRRSVHVTTGTGGSFGATTLRSEIGLGDAKRIEVVKIFWPVSRKTQTFTDLELDRTYRIVEGKAKARLLDLPRFSLMPADKSP